MQKKNCSFATRTGLREALLKQKMVQGVVPLAADLAEKVELLEITAGDILIEQGADDHDIYFILAGCFEVVFHNTKIGVRGPGEHVGEMAAVLTSLRRSATVRATESGWVAKLSATGLCEIAARHRSVWRRLM